MYHCQRLDVAQCEHIKNQLKGLARKFEVCFSSIQAERGVQAWGEAIAAAIRGADPLRLIAQPAGWAVPAAAHGVVNFGSTASAADSQVHIDVCHTHTYTYIQYVI